MERTAIQRVCYRLSVLTNSHVRWDMLQSTVYGKITISKSGNSVGVDMPEMERVASLSNPDFEVWSKEKGLYA